MLKSPVGIRRVVLVVLDGFRPDAIDHYGLANLQRLSYGGAWTTRAEPTLPSVKAAVLFRDVAERVGSDFDVASAHFTGRDSWSTVRLAQRTLAMQRRGLILMHWSDAHSAAIDHGYGSARMHEAAQMLDRSIGLLAAQIEVPRDPGTVLMVISDHARVAEDQPLHGFRDDRELLVIAGRSVVQSPLPKTVSILDVAPTILWALGLGGGGLVGALRPAFRLAAAPAAVLGERLLGTV